MDNKMVALNEKELEKVDGGFVISGVVFLTGCLATIFGVVGLVDLLS